MFQKRKILSILLCLSMLGVLSGCSDVAESYEDSYSFLYKVYLDDVEDGEKVGVVEDVKKEFEERGLENGSRVEVSVNGEVLKVNVDTNDEEIQEVRGWLEADTRLNVMIQTDEFDGISRDEELVAKKLEELKENIRNEAVLALDRIKNGEDFLLVAQEESARSFQHVYYEEVDWKSFEDLNSPFDEILSNLKINEVHSDIITKTTSDPLGGFHEYNVLVKLIDVNDDNGLKKFKYQTIIYEIKPDGYKLVNGISDKDLELIEKLYDDEYTPYYVFHFNDSAKGKFNDLIDNQNNNGKILAFFVNNKNIYSLLIREDKEEQIRNGEFRIYPQDDNEINNLFENNLNLKAPLIYLEGSKVE